MKVEYSKNELAYIIETVRAAEYSDYMATSAWARAAKVLEALAADRLKLLSEVRQLLDAIYAEDIVSSSDLGKVYEKIVRELGE